MATTTTKQTREEKKASAAAELRRARAFEYRDTFRKARARRTYTDKAAWEAKDLGDHSGFALYDLVYKFNTTLDSLKKNLRRAQEQLAEALPRVEKGRDPFGYSNGFTGYVGLDVDRDAATLDVLRTAVRCLASGTGWRVREVEIAYDREHFDMLEGVDAVQCGGAWSIRKLAADGTARWFHPDPDKVRGIDGFGPDGFPYSTEEAAWEAVHVLAEGRTL